MTVTDGSGNIQSQTTYAYDQTTPTATTNTPEHVAVTAPRGNPTTVTKLVSGSTTIQKTIAYNDTGTVASETDFQTNPPNVTTYGYGTNSCGNSYPDSVKNPLWVEKTTVWDCNGGVATSVTDQNSQPTLYKYQDPNYWRLTETDFPDGGQINTAYNLGTSRPWNIVQTTKQTTTQNIVRETIYDTLARVSQRQLQNDPDTSGGTDITDTTYDAAGHVHSVSNPHGSAASLTDGLTIYTYDGLGRVTTQQQPDGSAAGTQYNANCTTVTDEGGHTRKSCSDGLGRLTEVDEPGAGAALAKTATGNISISGTIDQSATVNECPTNPNGPCDENVPDSGTIDIMVDGFFASASYGVSDSASGLASALATQLNAGGSPVSASSSGNTIVMTAREPGAVGNLSWTASVSWNSAFTAPSFGPCGTSGSCSGSLSGGVDATFGSAPLVTLYQYNTLDNLLCAVQKATDTTAFTTCAAAPAAWRPRSFTYDSLSRLLSATNPESGAITYTYDNNGNVHTKTAPSPNQPATGTATVTTTYTYDKLNRLTNKSYSDTDTSNPATAPVDYAYDGNSLPSCPAQPPPGDADSFPIGYRSSMCDFSGATNWTHDKMGRINQEKRTIGGAAGKVDTDVYNLDGSVASMTVLGFNVSYTYNGAGRPVTAVSSGTTNTTYASNATYAPFGGLTSATLGAAPITITNSYNRRLQPTFISAAAASPIMSLCYDFHSETAVNSPPCSFGAGSGDNGNVFQIVNNRDGNRTQNFLYDPLNRISQANSSGSNWGETFTIDAWGNLTNKGGVSGKTNTEPLSASATVQNRLTGFGYDAAGNMISNGSATYVYDAENRLIAAGGQSYKYDGDGKRVEKCTESTPGLCTSTATATKYWMGWTDDVSAETDLPGNVIANYVFFNGQRIARRDVSTGAIHYYFSDHLGTHSLVTDANGTMPPQEESDFYPYGGEIPITSGDTNHYKFTGKERDAETGLDNFEVRYNASSMGRFMTPDPLGGDREDPQSLNRYSYTRNNPVDLIDPTGTTFEEACSQESNTCRDNGNGQLVKFEASEDKFGQFQFSPVQIDSGENGNLTDQNGNKFSANVTGAGVMFTQSGSDQASTGVFENGSRATTINGTGALAGFTFNFTESNMATGVNAKGTFTFNGNSDQTDAALENAGFHHYWQDEFDFLHPSTLQYDAVDFRSSGEVGTGAGSGHFTVDEPTAFVHGVKIRTSGTVPTKGTLHLGEHNPYNGGFGAHAAEVWHYFFQ